MAHYHFCFISNILKIRLFSLVQFQAYKKFANIDIIFVSNLIKCMIYVLFIGSIVLKCDQYLLEQNENERNIVNQNQRKSLINKSSQICSFFLQTHQQGLQILLNYRQIFQDFSSLQSLFPNKLMLVIEHIDNDLFQIFNPHIIFEDAQALNTQYPYLMKLILKHLKKKSLNIRNLLNQLLFFYHQRDNLPHGQLPFPSQPFHNRPKFFQSLKCDDPSMKIERSHFKREEGDKRMYKFTVIFIQKLQKMREFPQNIIEQRLIVDGCFQFDQIQQKSVSNMLVPGPSDQMLQEINRRLLLRVQDDCRLLLYDHIDLGVMLPQRKNQTDKLFIKLVLGNKIFVQKLLFQFRMVIRPLTGSEKPEGDIIGHANKYIIIFILNILLYQG